MGQVDQRLDGRPFGPRDEGVGQGSESLSDKEIGEALDALARDIEAHPVFQNPYFRRLKSGEPFTSETFQVHTDNFFERTRRTRQLIAAGCARAAGRGDSPTLTLLARVLYEETGGGDPELCHERLMVASHGRFGEMEFGLPPQSIPGLADSSRITWIANRYGDFVDGLMEGDYLELLGALLAVETHAEPMLVACREAFRRSRDKLSPEEFRSEVEAYFNIHVGLEDGPEGVEDRHAADAMRCVAANVTSPSHLNLVRNGAIGVLDVQQRFWEELAVASEGTAT